MYIPAIILHPVHIIICFPFIGASWTITKTKKFVLTLIYILRMYCAAVRNGTAIKAINPYKTTCETYVYFVCNMYLHFRIRRRKFTQPRH